MNLITDETFTPRIDKYTSEKGRIVLDAWEFTIHGQPIPTAPDQRGALWHGRKFNDKGETPIIVARASQTSKFHEIADACFHFGLVLKIILDEADDVAAEYLAGATRSGSGLMGRDETSELDRVLEVIGKEVIQPGSGLVKPKDCYL